MTRNLCRVLDCLRPSTTSGYCAAHWLRVVTTGDPQAHKPIRFRRRKNEPRPACKVTGCERPALARGWCEPHVARFYRTGDVKAHIPIQTRKKYRAPTAPGTPTLTRQKVNDHREEVDMFTRKGGEHAPSG